MHSAETLTALMLAPSLADYAALEAIFRREGWALGRVATFREALELAHSGEVPMIIAPADADRTWQRLVTGVYGTLGAPRIIVSSRLADERLWAEVLNEGGFDLMCTPFDSHEVCHVVGHAWRSWHFERRSDGPRRPLMPAPEAVPTAGFRVAERRAI